MNSNGISYTIQKTLKTIALMLTLIFTLFSIGAFVESLLFQSKSEKTTGTLTNIEQEYLGSGSDRETYYYYTIEYTDTHGETHQALAP